MVKEPEKMLNFIGDLHGPNLIEIFYSSMGLSFEADESIYSTTYEESITYCTPNGVVCRTV